MADDTSTFQDEDSPAETARGWIARMASGAMDGDDLARFKAWRDAAPAHNHAFEQQRAIWRAIEPAHAGGAIPAPRRMARRWFGRHAGLRRPAASLAAACAAALIAFVGGPDMIMALRADHLTGAAVRHVTLPDGSLAVLDAQSALALHYTAGERRVEVLRGAVWFQVAHGDRRPFRAAALGGETQDIGTAFEVRRQGESVNVGVTQGAVAVHAGKTPAGLILHASERAHYDRNGAVMPLGALPAGDIAVWRKDELLLNRASVSEAVSAIRRYRRGPVFLIGHGAKNTSISAVFRTDRPDEAMDAVAQMAGLSVYRLAGVTVLRGEN